MADRIETVAERVARVELPFDALGFDPYGISRAALTTAFAALEPFYRRYFRVRCQGLEHVPARGRAMLVGNHSGGVGLDGAMVIAAAFFGLDPPRLAQGMAERFIGKVPFASTAAARTGQFTGLPEHAERLLEDERLLLVFPEGSRGTAKRYWERYSLVDFGTGFMRLALQTKTPIIPFAFLGGGSAIPTFVNLYGVGRRLGVPYIPLTPWVLPLPRPARLNIQIGEAMRFEGSGNEEDRSIAERVARVKGRIRELIERGRAARRERFRTEAGR